MAKPTIYLDTSIISALWYKGANVEMGLRRARTREWWEWESRHFDIWASRFVEAELRAGSFAAQSDCVRMVRRIRYLGYTPDVGDLIHELLNRRVVPPTKPGDAAQLAVSCVHQIDDLLTWNYAHMANPSAQSRLAECCKRWELRASLLVSPETIPQARHGQTIRRKRQS